MSSVTVSVKKSESQRLEEMNWLTVGQEARLATLRMTHGIVHRQIPEEISSKMPMNIRCFKVNETRKLDTKPKYLNSNKQTQGSFRSQAYEFNTLPHCLTDMEDPKRYKKWLKIFIQYPSKLPKPLPKPEVEKANDLIARSRKQSDPNIKTKWVRALQSQLMISTKFHK